MFNQSIFSERIKQLRKSKNLRQEDIGNMINVTKAQISEIENGRKTTTLENITIIADYFNVSIDYLTGRTDNPSMSNIIIEQKLSEEEEKILVEYRKANILERNIIKGKLAEFEYNREVEKNNIETSDEFIDIRIGEKLNR